MTEGQQQSLLLVYVNVSNALIYSENLLLEDNVSKIAKDSIRVIASRLSWIKRAMELKTDSMVLRKIDTLKYDEIIRAISSLPDELQDEVETVIVSYVDKRIDELYNNKTQ
jgi:hypothetical protein